MPSLIGTVVPYTDIEAVVALLDGIYKVNLGDRGISLIVRCRIRHAGEPIQ